MEYSEADFVSRALDEFPELGEWFEENAGLLHVQMGALSRIAQEAKGDADWARYTRVMKLVDELYRLANASLKNALNVSFLEHLDFEGPRGPNAWAIMTPRLQQGWREMQSYLDTLFSQDRSRRPKGP